MVLKLKGIPCGVLLILGKQDILSPGAEAYVSIAACYHPSSPPSPSLGGVKALPLVAMEQDLKLVLYLNLEDMYLPL